MKRKQDLVVDDNIPINYEGKKEKKQFYFTKNKNKRLFEIDFVRACSCLGIIIFHFYAHIFKPQIKFLYYSPNSSYGFLYSTSFFAISGIVLFNKYSKIESLKSFYFKRWKSIFPPFYLCYFYFFYKTIFYLKEKNFIFKCPKSYFIFIFTILGIDGFFSYKYCTYYLMGEWFLGAIIMIYVLYPILIWAMKKIIYTIIISSFIISCYIFMISSNFFEIPSQMNLIVCIVSFCFGIISLKYKKFFYENKFIGIASIIFLVLLCFIRVFQHIIIFQIQGFLFLISSIHVGKYVMNTKIKSIFILISKHSFNVYLFHHHIISDVQAIITNRDLFTILISIILVILIALIHSQIIFLILNYIFKSNLFIKIESKFYVQ